MHLHCEEDLPVLYAYMLSQRRHGNVSHFNVKPPTHNRQSVVDQAKTYVFSSSGNETQRRQQVMHRNAVRPPAVTHIKNEARLPIMYRNESNPSIGYKSSSSRRLVSSSSSASSAKKTSASSSTTSYGERAEKPACRESRAPTLSAPKKPLFPSESVIVGWRKSVPVGSGFVNLGNTCYMNSTLQALFHVPSFVYWLMTDETHPKKCELEGGVGKCLICPVVKTVQNSHRMSGNVMRPSEIYSKLRLICKHLRHGSQEDAHEFLRYLLEGMERSYLAGYSTELDNLAKETTPIGQIFGGYIRTEVTCLECRHVSTTFQHFQELILDIQSASSVDEALEQYFTKESLGDGYKCDKCKKRVEATKKFSLEKPPKVLCIQLKRFETFGGKNNKHVSLKQWVDMEKFLHKSKSHQPLRYKLVSMILHHGYGSSCGHYTAVGLTSGSGYYLFDDSSVSPMLLNDVLRTNPYILMYELHVKTSTSTSGHKNSSAQDARIRKTRNY